MCTCAGSVGLVIYSFDWSPPNCKNPMSIQLSTYGILILELCIFFREEWSLYSYISIMVYAWWFSSLQKTSLLLEVEQRLSVYATMSKRIIGHWLSPWKSFLTLCSYDHNSMHWFVIHKSLHWFGLWLGWIVLHNVYFEFNNCYLDNLGFKSQFSMISCFLFFFFIHWEENVSVSKWAVSLGFLQVGQ